MARWLSFRWAIFNILWSPIVSIRLGGVVDSRPFGWKGSWRHHHAISAVTPLLAGTSEAPDEHNRGTIRPLAEYFARHGLDSAEIIPEVKEEARIPEDGTIHVKTIIFQAKGCPFAAVLREDLVADTGKLAQHLGLPSRQVTLAGAAFVEELTGFQVGTIPPLGHRTPLRTVIDAELLQYSVVVGGAGERGFDSRLSVDDLLKATGAEVIEEMARPRANASTSGRGPEGGVKTTTNNGRPNGIGLTSDGGARGETVLLLDGVPRPSHTPPVGCVEDADGSHESTAQGTNGQESTNADLGFRSPSGGQVGRWGHSQGLRDPGPDGPGVHDMGHPVSAALRDALPNGHGGNGDFDAGATPSGTMAPSARGKSGEPSSVARSVHSGANRAHGDTVADAEARLRIVTAAMHTVLAALLAVSGSVGGVNGAGENPGGEAATEIVGGHAGTDVQPAPEITSINGSSTRTVGEEEQRPTAATSIVYGSDVAEGSVTSEQKADSGKTVRVYGTDGEAGGVLLSVPTQGSGDGRLVERDDAGPGTRTAVMESKNDFGGELARVSGTPTIDAIGGDVHLVAVVAAKRSLTRLLHFVDLVPAGEYPMNIMEHVCPVRKAWISPGPSDGSPPRPIQVQLIMGKTLVDRLGQEEAGSAMKRIKRGQLVYVTGRPTPDTRQRFSASSSPASAPNTGSAGGDRSSGVGVNGSPSPGARAVAAATTARPNADDRTEADSRDSFYSDAYDLVCCSIRVLEEPPAVEPVLVGKGDRWEDDREDFLRMDLAPEAVAYVDTAAALEEMGVYLRKTFLTQAAQPAGGARAVLPALAVDCEWRPGKEAGDQRSPVSLLQLAAGERVFLVDMLYVSRPLYRDQVAVPSLAASPSMYPSAAKAEEQMLGGFTKTEALLDHALREILSAPGVAKVGMGPKVDFSNLVRSYPHMTCFRRISGAVDLSDVARNAASLRGKPSEEKGSLSRISGAVLGKRMDKSEQCSDWGMRPLSGRQRRYAALDARATLLLYRKLAPEVPPSKLEALLNSFLFDHVEVSSKESEGTSPYPPRLPPFEWGSPTPPRVLLRSKRSRLRGRRAQRKLLLQQQQQRAPPRKRTLNAEAVNVSNARLDVDGLRKGWLGRGLVPDLTKEGVVRACMDPDRYMAMRGSLPPSLVFDRHQNFVEFENGFALLMNCGGTWKGRQDASGFLDRNGSIATWCLVGSLSSSDTWAPDPVVVSSTYEQDQSRFPQGQRGPGAGRPGDAVARFLQRLAEVSQVSSSLLGELLPNEDAPPPKISDVTMGTIDWVGFDDRGESAGVSGRGPASLFPETPGAFSLLGKPEPPRLVLFARAKGRPFVYCGEVDCIAQEFVSNAGSSRLGAVRLTLALREWREAIAVAEADDEAFSKGKGGSGGGVFSRTGGVYNAGVSPWGGSIGIGDKVDGFLDIIRAGLKSEKFVDRDGSE